MQQGVSARCLGVARACRVAFVDLLAPRTCVGCEEEGNWLCAVCVHRVAEHANVTCIGCGMLSPHGATCDRCRPVVRLRGVVAATAYGDVVVQRIIHTTKYARAADVARAWSPLVERFVRSATGDALRAALGTGAVVVPVPLSARRLRARGFNQSELLAGEFVRMGWTPELLHALERPWVWPWRAHVQARLTRMQRLQNVIGAFRVRHNAAAAIRARHVLLVDDVVTTGATLTACAHALRDAGAYAVWGFALAREV